MNSVRCVLHPLPTPEPREPPDKPIKGYPAELVIFSYLVLISRLDPFPGASQARHQQLLIAPGEAGMLLELS